ncbi:hypothetical protein [Agromyces badenianii]|uniref:hypothetical protein n=1 Tax=Agromyces badenianii TaxID=2080742 RepID=UPI000D58F6A2|nr:hypothetical protein [Agromyces badenianii]PWC05325.1 hypothetical protein DCE94_03305 [Agromyces badenianii]
MTKRVFGVFLQVSTLDDPSTARSLVASAARHGLSHVFVEHRQPPRWLTDACHAWGMQLIVSMACFFEDDLEVSERSATVEPISAEGRSRPRLEWYTGAVPTDGGIADGLAARAVALLLSSGADGIGLDFIRWPMHWELELRTPGPRLGEYSFDERTVALFCAETGLDLPRNDPAAAAQIILGSFEEEWRAFRTKTITDVVQRVSGSIRAVRPDAWVGAFLVPQEEFERSAAVGQSAAQLAPYVDALLPMAYHSIIHQDVGLASRMFADVRLHADGPAVVPVVQTTADPHFAGAADWGSPFDFDDLVPELGRLADTGHGFVLFPAEGLSDAAWSTVARVIRERTDYPDEQLNYSMRS